VKASTLEGRLAALGPVWDTCRRLDAQANRPPVRPVMAGDTVTWAGRTWRVEAIDSTHGHALLRRQGRNRWAPITDLAVTR